MLCYVTDDLQELTLCTEQERTRVMDMDLCFSACVCVCMRLGCTPADYPGSCHGSPSHFNDNGRSASITAASLPPNPQA